MATERFPCSEMGSELIYKIIAGKCGRHLWSSRSSGYLRFLSGARAFLYKAGYYNRQVGLLVLVEPTVFHFVLIL